MSTDNVSNITIEELKEETLGENKSANKQEQKLDEQKLDEQKNTQEHTVKSALQALYVHYKKEKMNIEMIAPYQMLDGQLVEFVDKDTREKLAVARLRTKNQLLLDKESSQMSIAAYLTDLSAIRDSVSFTLEQK